MRKIPKGHKAVKLGGAQSPLPTFDPVSGVTGALAGNNSVVTLYSLHEDRSRRGAKNISGADDRITVQDRTYSQLMRLLPSRGMLPHLLHELVERDPHRVKWDKHSYVCRYVGPPSIGKSFMIKTLGKLIHPRGCLYLNCKDVDMGTIFCETVFDTSAANKEKAAIDAKVLQGNKNKKKGLQKGSIEMLRHAFGEAFIEEDRNGRTVTSIDWNGIKIKGDTVEAQNYQKQVLRETIQQVCEIEGIKLSSDLGQIGITTRDGLAIRAADPKSADYGRPILLDEFMRCKPGTAQKLYEFIALLSDPQVDRLEVIGGENRPFTFRRNDLPLTFRVNMTDNPAMRGMGSSAMDSPLTSRLGIELDTRTVPDPAMVDYADRIGQSMTGVPIMQIYYSGKQYFDQNPAKLVEVLRQYRTRGLTKPEIKNIPAEEMLNIGRAFQTIALSEQLADFFAGLKPLFNPDSAAHTGGNINISHEYEDYLRGIEIDLRLATKLIEKASVVMPAASNAGAVNYAAAFKTVSAPEFNVLDDEEDRLANRGSRLENYMLDWLKQVLIPADAATRGIRLEECKKLHEAVQKHAANCGIGDPALREAEKGGVKSVRQLYDVGVLQDPEEQLRLIRDLMLDQIREQYEKKRKAKPKLPPLPDDNDAIVPIAQMQLAVKHAAQLTIGNLPAHAASIVLPNMGSDQFAERPFAAFLVKDSIPPANENSFEPSADNLVDRDAVLMALALPDLQVKTLKGLWNNKVVELQNIEPSDEAIQIASGISETGFAVTSIAAAYDGKLEPIHVLKKNDSQILVVSGEADARLQRMMKSNGIIYVDYNASNAAQQIDDTLSAMTASQADRDAFKEKLLSAFLVRNGLPDHEAENRNKTLGGLMAAPLTVPAVMPIYATIARSAEHLAKIQPV